MRQKPLEPNFNLSQADLVLTATAKLGYMQRDKADFATRGIDEARIAGLNTLIQQFADMPTEQEMVQTAAALTLTKDESRAELLTAMQVLMGKISLRHDNRTPAYKAFGTSGLNSASEADLYMGIRRAVRVGKRTLGEYGAQGVSLVELDALESRNETFLEALHRQQDAENDSEAATQTRLRAANNLYAELSYLCEVGKTLYAQTDVTKYEQYVVYDQVAAAPAVLPVPAG